MTNFAEYVGRTAGSHLLNAVMGETTRQGEFRAATFTSVDGVVSELAPVIVSHRSVAMEVDPDNGSLHRRETVTLHGRREDFEAVGITGPQVAGVVALPDGSEWAIDGGATTWNASRVTLGLARKILVRHHENRRADV